MTYTTVEDVAITHPFRDSGSATYTMGNCMFLSGPSYHEPRAVYSYIEPKTVYNYSGIVIFCDSLLLARELSREYL